MRNALLVTLTFSLAGLGCSANQAPAGTSAPAVSSSSGTSVKPAPMVSGAVDPGVDAMAILKANEGYQGRNLGPAAPASGGQQTSGQAVTSSPQVMSASAGSSQGETVVSGSGGGLAVGTNTGAVLTAQGMSNAATTGIVPTRATGSVTTSNATAANTAVVAGATPVAGTSTVSAPVAAASRTRPTAASAPATSATASQGTRIVTGADGRQVMTNAAPPRSRIRRVTDALRITRSTTTTTTTTPTTNP